MDKEKLKTFLQMLVSSDSELGDAFGRVLILKHYVSPHASPAQLNMIIHGLKLNVRVQVLYVPSFEQVSFLYLRSQAQHLLCTYATLTLERSRHQSMLYWKDVPRRTMKLGHDNFPVNCNPS
jgi:hypothetical protein